MEQLKLELEKTTQRAKNAERRAEAAEGLLASLTGPLEELQTESNEIGRDLAWMLERYTEYTQRTQEAYARLSNFYLEGDWQEPTTVDHASTPGSASERHMDCQEAPRSDSPEPPRINTRVEPHRPYPSMQHTDLSHEFGEFLLVPPERGDLAMSDSHGSQSDQHPPFASPKSLSWIEEVHVAPQRQLRFLEPLSETRPELAWPKAGSRDPPAANTDGQRTCQACGTAGKFKDGVCVEKWRTGPKGYLVICSRCSKRHQRVAAKSALRPVRFKPISTPDEFVKIH